MNGSSLRHWQIPVLVILLAAVVTTATYPLARRAAYDALIERSGAPVPEGSGTMRFIDQPIRMVSVHGRPWNGANTYGKEEGVYHLVVLFPSGQISQVESMSEGSSYGFATRDRWTVLAGSMLRDVHVESSYTPAFRSVRVAGERFSLSGGNVFVVRMGDGARLRVTQVNATVRHPTDWREIERAIQARMADDHGVQRIFRGLHGGGDDVRCPWKDSGETASARTSSA